MKKIVLTILVVLLLTAMIPSAAAKSIITFGDWTVTFAGTETTAFAVDSHSVGEADVTVPNTLSGVDVVALNHHSMMNDSVITSLTLGNNLTVIGDYALLNCPNLCEVRLSGSIQQIGASAFSGCRSLKKINLEASSLSTVSEYTFLNSGLETVILPDTCTKISSNAFAQCSGLKKIVIPESVTSIEDNVFRASDSAVIYCYADSAAHQYAAANNIPYVLINGLYMLGDADSDGEVTVVDATVIQRFLAEMDVHKIDMNSATVSGDELKIVDVNIIQRYLADIDIDYPVGEWMTF